MPRVVAIVVAAGDGRRFGGVVGKQWVEVAGRPVVDWSIDRLLEAAEEVAVAVPAAVLEKPPSGFADHPRVHWVAGGATRWQSVQRAFAAIGGGDDDLIAVHDGARPAVDFGDVAAVVAAAAESGAAVLGREVVDTMKRVSAGRIVETVERSELFRAETPQVLRREVLERCVTLAAENDLEPTDESSIAERLEDISVAAVIAREANPKVTEVGDLALVSSLLAARE